MENHDMEFLGESNGYMVYMNNDGFAEGYKKIGRGHGSNCNHIITNQKTIEGFSRYVRGLREKIPLKERPIKISQFPQLPFNDAEL
jgi:hypothetical protein